MSAVKKIKRGSEITWAAVCRENTGTHPMDSGGDNGRHWQRKLPRTAVRLELTKHGVLAYISLSYFLDLHFEIDQELTAWLRGEDASNYREYADALADRLDMTVQGSDYTYNHENDLDQNFQWSVVAPAGEDWVYGGDSTLFIIETHNGADARGGFSSPVVCRLKSDVFPDVVAGVNVAQDGGEERGEEYAIGYSRDPMYHFNQDVERVLKSTVKGDSFVAIMKSGERFHCSVYFDGYL